jgi:hypothetical protein
MQLTTTDLPLERADEATYVYEFLAPEPLVSPEEETVLREIRTVGGTEIRRVGWIGRIRGGDDPIGGIHEIMEKGISESAPCRILFGGIRKGRL